MPASKETSSQLDTMCPADTGNDGLLVIVPLVPVPPLTRDAVRDLLDNLRR